MGQLMGESGSRGQEPEAGLQVTRRTRGRGQGLGVIGQGPMALEREAAGNRDKVPESPGI